MDLERIEELLRTRPPRERTYDRRLPDLLGGPEPVKASVRLRTRGGSPLGSRAAAVALVAIVVAGVALYGAWHQSQPVAVASPSASATSSTPTATASGSPTKTWNPSASSSPSPSVYPTAPPSSHHILPGPVQFSGSWAWMLSDSGVSVSEDGGRTWSDWGLPKGLTASSVMTVAGSPGRGVWLAAPEGQGVRLYRKPAQATAWSSTPLMPDWTTQDGVYPEQNIEHVILTPGPAGLVTVSETVGFGTTAAAETLFVSTDNGKTFVHRRPTGTGCVGCYWLSVTFVTSKSGVVVSGNSTKYIDVLHTSDGGTTWSLAAVTGLPGVADYELGAAFMVGTDIEIPVNIYPADVNGPPSLSLLVSHDGGATFKPAGTAAASGNIWGPLDSLGQVAWVFGDATTISETTNGGQTWTTVTATGLPETQGFGGLTSIHLTSPTSATALILEGNCGFVAPGCWVRWYLLETTDGGRTWTDF
ncbi:MAG TPA: hypothetical protein VIK06_00565 [Candidatus Limnocylindrales bacterium]|jgi:hypothetical protein